MSYSTEDVDHVDPEGFEDFVDEHRGQEGLASRRASGPETFANGITTDLESEGVVPEGTDPSDVFESLHLLTRDKTLVNGEPRTDVVLFFAESSPVDFNALALWRLDNGYMKWFSDYVDQEQA